MTDQRRREIAALLRCPDVSRETLGSLEQFEALLRRWTKRLNLVSKADVDRIWDRHILDSLLLVPWLRRGVRWLDLGSGGGFPSIPLAIVAARLGLGMEFGCVESNTRKAAFLREAARVLDLNLQVHNRRITELPEQSPDIVSARALAPIGILLDEVSRSALRPGIVLLLKGDSVNHELTAASPIWHIDYKALRQTAASSSSIVVIRDYARVKQR